MIKVSVFYPNGASAKFDMAYYLATYIPLVRQKLGSGCKGIAVDQGIAGGSPGTSPTYLASCHLLFNSLEEFQSAFAPHAAAIMGDIPNFTSVQPIIQINEVKL